MLTDQHINQFVNEDVIFHYDPVDTGTFVPTLVIGLGGTGMKVLRHLKKHLQRNSDHDILLMGIDTDAKESRDYPELPKLSDSELVELDGDIAARVLAQASAAPRQNRHILEFLPVDKPEEPSLHYEVGANVRKNAGAGQLRRAGRLFFQANLQSGANIMGRLREAHTRLTNLTVRQEKRQRGIEYASGARVYVIGSLAGGTGAGMMIDMLAAIRSVFDNPLDGTTAFCVLPGSLLDRWLRDPHKEMPQTRANAVGMLQELQAALMGELNEVPFHLGFGEEFRCRTRGLLEACYLVDQRLFNGSAPKDYMDLCNGVALFLYSLVGSGIGSTQESGIINTTLAQGEAAGQAHCCFRTLGVASVAYPLDDLELYALRNILDQWMNRWLEGPQNPERDATALAKARTALAIHDVDSFAARIRIDIEDYEYYPGLSDRNRLMKMKDHDFVAERPRRYAEVESALRRHSRQIEELSGPFIKANEEALSQLTCEWISCGRDHAESVVSALRQEVEALEMAWVQQKTNRIDRMGEIERTLPRKERWIHFNDWYDKPDREKYIRLVQELFRLKYESAFDGEVDEVMTDLLGKVKHWERWITELTASLERDRENNRKKLNVIDSASDGSDRLEFGVVQSAIARSDYKKWAEGVALNWPDQFLPPRPDKSALMEVVWRTMLPPFTDALKALDLIETAKSEKSASEADPRRPSPMLNRIKALDDSAIPAIRLTDAAPLPDRLAPEKFIVGRDVREQNQWILDCFTETAGGKKPVSQEIEPRHVVVCAQVFSGFAAVHWGGFADSYLYYQQNPWRARSLPDNVVISPLQPLDDEDFRSLKAISLGLMSGMLVSVNGTYYGNVVTDGSSWAFRMYRRDVGEVAEKLIEEGFISQADDDLLDPPPDSSLGGSLREVAAVLKSSVGAPLVDILDTIFTRTQNKLGRDWVKTHIQRFLNEDLQTHAGSDPTLSESITKALRLYVGRF